MSDHTIKKSGASDLFSSVAAMGDHVAVSVYSEDCCSALTYYRLIDCAAGLAGLVSAKKSTAILLHGGDAISISIALLSASLLKMPLILCDGNIGLPDADSALYPGDGIFTLSDSLPHRSMDFAEMTAASLGAPPVTVGLWKSVGDGFTLSFFSGDDAVSYSEADLLHSARQFAIMSGLCGGDATLSTLDPCSPVGLVCVLLPSLLTGGRAIFSSADELGEASRLVHPTRLTAAAESAAEAVEILKSDEGGALALPIPYRPQRRFPPYSLPMRAYRARLRRLCAARLMRLGGRLRSVCIVGDGSELYPGLYEVGIMSYSILSTHGCPFVGLCADLGSPLSWRPPRGLYADICRVGKGGIGLITLSGSGLAIPIDAPLRLGTTPHRFRLDAADGLSLVTHFSGYVLPNGNICLKNADFFRKSSCNSTKNIL